MDIQIPSAGAIRRLVEDVELLDGNAIVTPAIPSLRTACCAATRRKWATASAWGWKNSTAAGCRWGGCRRCATAGGRSMSRPAQSAALAVGRQLYDELRGFDPHMLWYGIEDLDFGLKCWLLGHSILHDPEASVGHRFQRKFRNYVVPAEQMLVNRLRMARKNFTHGVWADWLERCRRRTPQKLSGHPEGLWRHVWELFEARRASVEAERSYIQAHSERDEFWYAERFGLSWPRLPHEQLSPWQAFLEGEMLMAEGSPTPSPPDPTYTLPNPIKTGYELDANNNVDPLTNNVELWFTEKDMARRVTVGLFGPDAYMAEVGELGGTPTRARSRYRSGAGRPARPIAQPTSECGMRNQVAGTEVKVVIPRPKRTMSAMPILRTRTGPSSLGASY